jgi:DNA polymerase-3 subunit alpha
LAQGFSRRRTDELANKVPLFPWRQTWEEALSDSAELRAVYEKGGEEDSHALHLAEKLCGCLQHVGVHASGVVLSSGEMTDVLPVVDAGNETVGLVTQGDAHEVEAVGLMKVDVLGLAPLSLQSRCSELVASRHGVPVDFGRIAYDDEATMEVFAKGDTQEIFQFESEGIRDVLRKTEPRRFKDLVALYALYRPGVFEVLSSFLRRRAGEESATCAHPLMEDCLAETLGLAIYQEQVMVLAQRLGGLSRGESNLLRLALGKKQKAQVDEFRSRFVSGCLSNPRFRIGEWSAEPVARALAERIFREWEEFALYAFNKSHAVCYSLVAYRLAYLKAHWPDEFQEALAAVGKR